MATLALAFIAAVCFGAAAFAQACGRCNDNSIHIGPFSFPNPFARPSPPSEGVGGDDRPSHRHSASDRRHSSGGGGAMRVCVRTCDGSFFPLPYSGASGMTLEEVCQALCPNATMALYTMPFGGTIDEGASATGARYMALPNALKFQQTYDPTCSCRRPNESWADALAEAERLFGHHSHDILVTAEESAEMSRPKPDPSAQATARSGVPPPAAAAPGAAAALELLFGRRGRRHAAQGGDGRRQPRDVRH